MFVGPDPLDAHTSAVVATGIEAPAEWSELHNRLADFLTAPSPIPHRLADAVISGTGDVAALCAMAVAEASALPPAHAQVDATVKAAVLAKLREHYAPVALANYQQLATDFDVTADKFTSAASVIGPETPAEHLVHAVDRLRKAWSGAEQHAHQLTEQMTALAAAASLAGVATSQPEQLLALVCDPGGLHRRKVWSAFENVTGRTSRWGALVALGVTIRAHSLDGFEPYRRPKPMEVKQIPVARGAVRFEQVDPEDQVAAEVAAG